MHLKNLVGIAVVIAAVAISAPASATETFDVIVKLRDDSIVAAASGTGGHVAKQVASDTAVITVPAQSEGAAVALAESRDGVLWAEPDKIYRASRTANDPCFASTCSGQSQWWPSKIGLPEAWDTTTGDTAIKVAVIDSGIDVAHPDLSGHMVNGPNFSAESDLLDHCGHGTHVAGILGATTNNGAGVVGTAWNANVTSVKVLEDAPAPYGCSGSASSIALGLRWAADNGMRIANMSLGGDPSQTIQDAVDYAQSRGVLIIAAADNGGSSIPVYPAAYDGVISVGSSTTSDTLASFSNRGNWVDILAPGVNILSTWPTTLTPSNPYSVQSGTSMSTPMVAGTAALLWSARPYLSGDGVAERILGTAQPISGSGTVVATGRLNSAGALAPVDSGYRLAASDGGIFSFNATFGGSTGGQRLNKPIVAMTTNGRPGGYWLIASDGGVFNFGGAGFYGSTGAQRLNQPIVGGSSTKSGSGYWLVARDGGVFSFGDATFFGSTGAQRLNQPIVAMVPTISGRGYWLVASDGGVFSFGDAKFYGSTGGSRLNSPIVGASRTPRGDGYWLVAADGGIFSFGDATFRGSAGSIPLAKPVVSMTPTQTGNGYWLTASDGGVFSYGDAVFRGSTGGQRLNQPIVTITATP